MRQAVSRFCWLIHILGVLRSCDHANGFKSVIIPGSWASLISKGPQAAPQGPISTSSLHVATSLSRPLSSSSSSTANNRNSFDKNNKGAVKRTSGDSNSYQNNKVIKKQTGPPPFQLPPGAQEVFVGNLPFTITESEITKFIEAQIGSEHVLRVRIAMGKKSQAPRGFLFLDCPNVASAEKCVGLFDGLWYQCPNGGEERKLNSNMKDSSAPEVVGIKTPEQQVTTVCIQCSNLYMPLWLSSETNKSTGYSPYSLHLVSSFLVSACYRYYNIWSTWATWNSH